MTYMRRRPRRQEWRPVPGFEGLYQVSDQGLVWSLRRTIVLKPFSNRDGYLYVALHKDRKQTTHYLHRLVARTFLAPPPDGMEILHGPGGQRDNSRGNLRYGTHAENVRESVEQGTHASVAKETCPKKHPLDGKRRDGKRYCKQCNRDRRAANYAANPEDEKRKMREYYRRSLAA